MPPGHIFPGFFLDPNGPRDSRLLQFGNDHGVVQVLFRIAALAVVVLSLIGQAGKEALDLDFVKQSLHVLR